jgi:hypothetical protein
LQTAYFSPFPKAVRKFNASLLNSRVCTEKHFTIRLVQHANATEDIVWSAIVGLGERFTVTELLSFPIYVLINHANWNHANWTFWTVLFLFTPLLILAVRSAFKKCGVHVLELATIENGKLRIFFDSWREVWYELGVLGFTATALEMMIHLFIAALDVNDFNAQIRQFATGVFFVILIPNGLGIALCLNNWTAIRFRHQISKGDWPNERHCSLWWWKLSGNPWWSFFEIATGFSFFLLFGAGTFLGPACIMIAGLLRVRELQHSPLVEIVGTRRAAPVGSIPALFFSHDS